MTFSSYDTYLAAHKNLSNQEGEASKKYEEAQANTWAAISKAENIGTLHELSRLELNALARRDDCRKQIAGIEKANPEFDQQRKDEELKAAPKTEQEAALPAYRDGATLRKGVSYAETAVQVVFEPLFKMATGVSFGYPGAPPGSAPKISDHIPDGDLWQHAKNVVANAKGPDGKVMADKTGNPLADQVSVADVAQRTPVVDQWVKNYGQGIAEGKGPLKSAEDANVIAYKSMTGEEYGKTEGLREAVAQELQKRFGEPARVAYEQLAPTAEEEVKRIATLAGHVH